MLIGPGETGRYASLLQRTAAYLTAMAALCALVVYGAVSVFKRVERSVVSEYSATISEAARVSAVRVSIQLAEDTFQDMIRSEAFWHHLRASNAASSSHAARQRGVAPGSRLGHSPESLQPPASGLFAPWPSAFGTPGLERNSAPPDEQTKRASSGLRTLCVRLCDGYYWPISFSAGEDRITRDATTCSNSCTSPTRLFVSPNHSAPNHIEDMAEMRDLSGSPYQKLRTAFLYRTNYDGNCKCRPHSWERASLDLHRLYALQQKKRKGNRSVTDELSELRKKVSNSKKQQKDDLRRLKRSEARGWSTISLAALPPLPARRGQSLALVSPHGLAAVSLAQSVPGGHSALPTHTIRAARNEIGTGTQPPTSITASIGATPEGEYPRPDAPQGSSLDSTHLEYRRMMLGVRRPPKQASPAPWVRPPSEDWRGRVFNRD